MAKQKEYRERNKDRLKQSRLKRYRQNRERFISSQKNWMNSPRGREWLAERKRSGAIAAAQKRYGAKLERKAQAAAKYRKYKAERNWGERLSDNNRMKKYGLKRDQFAAMLAERNGRCDICRQEIASRPCLDHDHETGRVRGILCISCNSAIGQMKDSVELLAAAIAYLKKHKSVAA